MKNRGRDLFHTMGRLADCVDAQVRRLDARTPARVRTAPTRQAIMKADVASAQPVTEGHRPRPQPGGGCQTRCGRGGAHDCAKARRPLVPVAAAALVECCRSVCCIVAARARICARICWSPARSPEKEDIVLLDQKGNSPSSLKSAYRGGTYMS